MPQAAGLPEYLSMQNATRLNGWGLGLGRAASCCADQILEITLIWVVWQATHSSTYTGLAAFAQRAPFWILGFVGAGYVDRVGAVRMLRYLNGLAIVVALIGVTLVEWVGREALIIAAVSFLIGIARSMEAPALTTLVPSFSGVWSTQGLNNLLDNSKRLGRLAAPVPALLLGTIPPHLLLGTACFGYLVMNLVAGALSQEKEKKKRKMPAPHLFAQSLLGEGFFDSVKRIYLAGQLGLVLGASAIYAMLHGAAYFSIMPRVLLTQNNGAVGSYASIISAFALGGILSNLLISRIAVTRYATVVALGMLAAGLAFLLIGQVEGMLLLWGLGFIGGMSLPFQDVFITCLIQRDAPKEMLARAHAVWRLGCEAGIGLGMLLGGLAADAIDGSWLLILIGVGIALVALFIFIQDFKVSNRTL